MKNQEIKQFLYAKKQADRYRNKMMVRLLMVVLLMFTAPSICLAFEDSSAADESIVMLGGSTVLASMALIGNIEDVGDREVAGKQLSYKLYLVNVNQLSPTGFPSPNVAREVGQLPFKDGEMATMFEAHQILTSDSKGEKGDLSTAFTNTVTAIMGGNRDALLNFIEEFAGGKFILLYQDCNSGVIYTLGSPGKPMILKSFERADNLEKRAITFTFENDSWRQPCKYVGSIPLVAPVTLASGATSLAVQPTNDRYVVVDGVSTAAAISAVSGISVNDRGRVITLIGDGSIKPSTIADGSVFILEGGATWTARKGSTICLRIVDSSRLVEVSGTRRQTV